MAVTAFANHKGGVGKTFILEMIAAELAKRGRRVLAADLDPQANLSRRLGYLEADLEDRPTMAEAVQSARPDALRAALLPCQWEAEWAANITLAPSRIELENRVAEAGVPGSWLRLRKALAPLADEFDDVLLDTAPTLGHLLHLSLVASDYVVAPLVPEYDPVRGVHRLKAFIESDDNRQALGMQNLRLAGIILNAKRTGVSVHESRAAEAIATWGDLVWSPVVPLRAPAGEAVERGEPPQSCDGEAHKVIQAAATGLTDRFLKETAA
jgi:cellulose biosynthesis protein BcsQ